MGLFFENRQHLSELKKIFLLEKRIEKLEVSFERSALQSSKGGFSAEERRALQEELWNRLLPYLEEKLQELLEAKLKSLPGPTHSASSTPGEATPPEVSALKEKVEFLEFQLSEVEKLWESQVKASSSPSTDTPPPQALEELEKKLYQQVLEQLSPTVSHPAPPPNPEELHRDIKDKLLREVEELWQSRFWPQVESLLEKQSRRMRKLERKMKQLFFMVSQMDFDDEEEDDEEDLWFTPMPKKRRKKKRFPKSSAPAREEKPSQPMDPAKSAAIESLFQMNLDLQKNLIGT